MGLGFRDDNPEAKYSGMAGPFVYKHTCRQRPSTDQTERRTIEVWRKRMDGSTSNTGKARRELQESRLTCSNFVSSNTGASPYVGVPSRIGLWLLGKSNLVYYWRRGSSELATRRAFREQLYYKLIKSRLQVLAPHDRRHQPAARSSE